MNASIFMQLPLLTPKTDRNSLETLTLSGQITPVTAAGWPTLVGEGISLCANTLPPHCRSGRESL